MAMPSWVGGYPVSAAVPRVSRYLETPASRFAFLSTWLCQPTGDLLPTLLFGRVKHLQQALLATGMFQYVTWGVAGSAAKYQVNADWNDGLPKDIDPVVDPVPVVGATHQQIEAALKAAFAIAFPRQTLRKLAGTKDNVYLARLAGASLLPPSTNWNMPTAPTGPTDLRILLSRGGYDFVCNALITSSIDPRTLSTFLGVSAAQCIQDNQLGIYRRDHALSNGVGRYWRMQTKGYVPADDYVDEYLEDMSMDINERARFMGATLDDSEVNYQVAATVTSIMRSAANYGLRGDRATLLPAHLALIANGIVDVERAEDSILKTALLKRLRATLDMPLDVEDPASTKLVTLLRRPNAARQTLGLFGMLFGEPDGDKFAAPRRGDEHQSVTYLYVHALGYPSVRVELPMLGASVVILALADRSLVKDQVHPHLSAAQLLASSPAEILGGPGADALWPKTLTPVQQVALGRRLVRLAQTAGDDIIMRARLLIACARAVPACTPADGVDFVIAQLQAEQVNPSSRASINNVVACLAALRTLRGDSVEDIVPTVEATLQESIDARDWDRCFNHPDDQYQRTVIDMMAGDLKALGECVRWLREQKPLAGEVDGLLVRAAEHFIKAMHTDVKSGKNIQEPLETLCDLFAPDSESEQILIRAFAASPGESALVEWLEGQLTKEEPSGLRLVTIAGVLAQSYIDKLCRSSPNSKRDAKTLDKITALVTMYFVVAGYDISSTLKQRLRDVFARGGVTGWLRKQLNEMSEGGKSENAAIVLPWVHAYIATARDDLEQAQRKSEVTEHVGRMKDAEPQDKALRFLLTQALAEYRTSPNAPIEQARETLFRTLDEFQTTVLSAGLMRHLRRAADVPGRESLVRDGLKYLVGRVKNEAPDEWTQDAAFTYERLASQCSVLLNEMMNDAPRERIELYAELFTSLAGNEHLSGEYWGPIAKKVVDDAKKGGLDVPEELVAATVTLMKRQHTPRIDVTSMIGQERWSIAPFLLHVDGADVFKRALEHAKCGSENWYQSEPALKKHFVAIFADAFRVPEKRQALLEYIGALPNETDTQARKVRTGFLAFTWRAMFFSGVFSKHDLASVKVMAFV